jgi:hypothetical protein
LPGLFGAAQEVALYGPLVLSFLCGDRLSHVSKSPVCEVTRSNFATFLIRLGCSAFSARGSALRGLNHLSILVIGVRDEFI